MVFGVGHSRAGLMVVQQQTTFELHWLDGGTPENLTVVFGVGHSRGSHGGPAANDIRAARVSGYRSGQPASATDGKASVCNTNGTWSHCVYVNNGLMQEYALRIFTPTTFRTCDCSRCVVVLARCSDYNTR